MKNFQDIQEYIKLPREIRRNHLCLDEECIEIGGDSRIFRGLLAHFLNTTIGDRKIYVCHACYNAKCSNPRHLYWGTPKDNVIDTKESGRWKSIYQSTIDKYGKEYATEIRINAAIKGGKSGGGHNALAPEELKIWQDTINKFDIKKYGFISQLAREMNCSHTHVRRVLKKYFPDISTCMRKIPKSSSHP